MASTAARAALPAISATNSSTLRVEIVCICANWSSESRDDRVSSGCCDVVGYSPPSASKLLRVSRALKLRCFVAWQPFLESRHRHAEDLPYHSRSY